MAGNLSLKGLDELLIMAHQYLNNMKEIFVKKYWNEGDVILYLHFQNNKAVRQLEITAKRKVFLTQENSVHRESMLYDQSLDDLDLQPTDFITEEEFIKVWNDK